MPISDSDVAQSTAWDAWRRSQQLEAKVLQLATRVAVLEQKLAAAEAKSQQKSQQADENP